MDREYMREGGGDVHKNMPEHMGRKGGGYGMGVREQKREWGVKRRHH